MPASSSHFSAGDLVEIRSAREILATLDADGRCEGLPFMPEMLRYCGGRFLVASRAHKTCDFVTHTGIRALPRAVHLAGLRCDGAAHGGCQARCLLYWKDAWLRFAPPGSSARFTPATDAGADEAARRLAPTVHAPGSGPADADPVFVCQATQLPEFTRPLSPWDPRAYLEDFRSGNQRSPARFIQGAAYRACDNLVNLGIGLGRPLRALYDLAQRLRGSPRLYPGTPGRIPAGRRTPVLHLDLQPGELVRVKDHAAILATLDTNGRNLGLSFSAEMTPYCGATFRVLDRVERIVDERTGRLRRMKEPCILLEGAVCGARFNRRMLFCPRATYSYWREIWLERVAPAPAAPLHPAPRSAFIEPHSAPEPLLH